MTAEWVLRAYFRHRAKSVRQGALHQSIRDSRSRIWWEVVKDGNYKRRKLFGEVKTHNCSRTYHEDALNVWKGLGWKQVLLEANPTELKELELDFVESL